MHWGEKIITLEVYLAESIRCITYFIPGAGRKWIPSESRVAGSETKPGKGMIAVCWS